MLYICLFFLGTLFKKRIADAIKMQAKHEEIFEKFSARFDETLIEKWKKIVEAWEADPSKPNPYKEKITCM